MPCRSVHAYPHALRKFADTCALAIRDKLVAQAKLIYERSYGEIGADLRATVLPLYEMYPRVHPQDYATVSAAPEDCGFVTHLPGDDGWHGAEQSCEGLDEIAWRYIYCGRLRSSHADPAWREDPEALEICFSLSEAIESVWDDVQACPDASMYLELAREVQRDLIDEARTELAETLEQVDMSTPATRAAGQPQVVASIAAYISTLDLWSRWRGRPRSDHSGIDGRGRECRGAEARAGSRTHDQSGLSVHRTPCEMFALG